VRYQSSAKEKRLIAIGKAQLRLETPHLYIDVAFKPVKSVDIDSSICYLCKFTYHKIFLQYIIMMLSQQKPQEEDDDTIINF